MSLSSDDDDAVEFLGTVPPSHPSLPPLFKEEECDSQSSGCPSGDAESNTVVQDSDHDSGHSSSDGSPDDVKITDAANSVLREKIHRFMHFSEIDVPSRDLCDDESASETAYVEFDATIFHSMCDVQSEDYDAELANNLQTVEQEVFQTGSLWQSRALLLSVVKAIGKRRGWVPRLDGIYIKCNRFGTGRKDRSHTKRNSSVLAVGCGHCLTLHALKTIRVVKEGATRPQFRHDFSGPVRISKSVTEHSGQCRPSSSNLAAVSSSSGRYVRSVPTLISTLR